MILLISLLLLDMGGEYALQIRNVLYTFEFHSHGLLQHQIRKMMTVLLSVGERQLTPHAAFETLFLNHSDNIPKLDVPTATGTPLMKHTLEIDLELNYEQTHKYDPEYLDAEISELQTRHTDLFESFHVLREIKNT